MEDQDLPPLEQDNSARAKELAQQLKPDPLLQNLMADSEYFLFVYTVSGAVYQQQQLGTLGEIFSFLEDNGTVIGKLAFKAGTTVKFFKAIQDFTGGLDLMALLGTTVEENAEEDEMCCGVLEENIASQAVERLGGLADEAQLKRFEAKAKAVGIDTTWAIESAKVLRASLEKALEGVKGGNGVIMGLFE